MKEQLTAREKEIFALLIKGISYKEVADKLYISLNTVKYHAKNIYLKSGSKNKIELILKNLKIKTTPKGR